MLKIVEFFETLRELNNKYADKARNFSPPSRAQEPDPLLALGLVPLNADGSLVAKKSKAGKTDSYSANLSHERMAASFDTIRNQTVRVVAEVIDLILEKMTFFTSDAYAERFVDAHMIKVILGSLWMIFFRQQSTNVDQLELLKAWWDEIIVYAHENIVPRRPAIAAATAAAAAEQGDSGFSVQTILAELDRIIEKEIQENTAINLVQPGQSSHQLSHALPALGEINIFTDLSLLEQITLRVNEKLYRPRPPAAILAEMRQGQHGTPLRHALAARGHERLPPHMVNTPSPRSGRSAKRNFAQAVARSAVPDVTVDNFTQDLVRHYALYELKPYQTHKALCLLLIRNYNPLLIWFKTLQLFLAEKSIYLLGYSTVDDKDSFFTMDIRFNQENQAYLWMNLKIKISHFICGTRYIPIPELQELCFCVTISSELERTSPHYVLEFCGFESTENLPEIANYLKPHMGQLISFFERNSEKILNAVASYKTNLNVLQRTAVKISMPKVYWNDHLNRFFLQKSVKSFIEESFKLHEMSRESMIKKTEGDLYRALLINDKMLPSELRDGNGKVRAERFKQHIQRLYPHWNDTCQNYLTLIIPQGVFNPLETMIYRFFDVILKNAMISFELCTSEGDEDASIETRKYNEGDEDAKIKTRKYNLVSRPDGSFLLQSRFKIFKARNIENPDVEFYESTVDEPLITCQASMLIPANPGGVITDLFLEKPTLTFHPNLPEALMLKILNTFYSVQDPKRVQDYVTTWIHNIRKIAREEFTRSTAAAAAASEA